MKKLSIGAFAAALLVLTAVPAFAHVTIQPSEAKADSFSRFVVRVPNEKDDSATIEVEVQLPPLAFVSFEDKDGWKRDVESGEFDESVDAFGQEITEGVLKVTWSGGAIEPGEFAEFGFSAKMPAEETSLEFKALQTYDDGEVVEWTGAEDSETPAALVTTFDLGGFEGGELAAVDAVADHTQGEIAEGEEEPEEAPVAGEIEDEGENEEEDDDDGGLGTILGGLGMGFGLIALAVALSNRRSNK